MQIVEGSHLYAPKVKLEQVILPADQKALVMATVSNFEAFTTAKKKYGMEDVVSYGSGLVLLFHGPSGILGCWLWVSSLGCSGVPTCVCVCVCDPDWDSNTSLIFVEEPSSVGT